MLYINDEYYNKHKEEITELIKYICKNKKEEYLYIASAGVINEEIISSVSQNKHIETLCLGNNADPYCLTKEDFDILKKTDIKNIKTNSVSDDLKEVFDSRIWYNMQKQLFGTTISYGQIQNIDSLWLYDEILDSQIENFKYLNKTLN